jgi:NAD(P)-dependent dehydrogenase (short-subunit alcohol dehydrogenase family)
MKPLEGKVALVAGATRGAGRGIARMLGEAGATVYCTGRGSRAQPSAGKRFEQRPETIEETAGMVDAAGGTGIPVRVDHAAEAQVAALFDRVRAGHGRLDVLVTVLGGPEVKWEPFWKVTLEHGREMLDGWVWPHIATARHAVPLMREGPSGLIVVITEAETLGYHYGSLFHDLVRVMHKRLAYALAEELAPDGVTALALVPGFMRTEEVLASLQATEESWREVAETSEEAKKYGFAGSETPCFVGRAVAALAADPGVARFSGGLHSSWELSEVYGFTDVDGRTPHWGRYFAENFPNIFGPPKTNVRWQIAAASSPAEAPVEAIAV